MVRFGLAHLLCWRNHTGARCDCAAAFCWMMPVLNDCPMRRVIFPCFNPKACPQPAPDDADFALLRMLPNEDLALGLDAVCARLGWRQAHVFGLGSLVGAEFDDGRLLDSFATEFVLLDAIAYGEAHGKDGLHPGPEIEDCGRSGRCGTARTGDAWGQSGFGDGGDPAPTDVVRGAKGHFLLCEMEPLLEGGCFPV